MQDHSPLGRFAAFQPAGPAGPAPRGRGWAELMALALAEARFAWRGGDVPVGALIADASGNIIASAANRVERDRNPVAHAEILALSAAAAKTGSPRLPGCVLVVTLEPCLMCAGAIAHSRIDGVVFGAADTRAGALVSAADACDLPLCGRSFWHLGGVRSGECAQLLQKFFQQKRGCHA